MRDELIDVLTAKLGDRMNECDELRKSNSQLIALNERLSKLIARIASGFKGEPAPDVTHSWHDLPALADLAGQMLKDCPAVWETIVIAGSYTRRRRSRHARAGAARTSSGQPEAIIQQQPRVTFWRLGGAVLLGRVPHDITMRRGRCRQIEGRPPVDDLSCIGRTQTFKASPESA